MTKERMNLVIASFSALVVLVFLAGAAFFWLETRKNGQTGGDASATGFIQLPTFDGMEPTTVVVLAPLNCTSEQRKRADKLVELLTKQGIPNRISNHARISRLPSTDPALINRINGVMTGEVPIVFINGKGKANPSAEEVIAEYRNKPL